jgi:type II secretory pathway pseudopilin PulG
MVSDKPTNLPRKKHNILWYIGGVFVLLVGLFLFQLAGPRPKIVNSRQTTYITSPLRPTGLPDYEEFLRQKLRNGVTPENNAAVLLYQAMWPSELSPQHYQAVATELGLSEIPSADSALRYVYGDENLKRIGGWLPKPADDGLPLDAESVIRPAVNHAWKSEQLPPLAEWVDSNKKPLDLIVEASRRPRYYSPSPTYLDAEHDMLIETLLPGAQAAREAARGLAVRAMYHVGENRPSDAWQDIFALYRLSSLVSQGFSLVEQLVAIAIRGMACEAAAVLLGSDELTAELARQIQSDLATVQPFANVANSVDQGERLTVLDAVLHTSEYGFGAINGGQAVGKDRSPVDYASIDWNIVLRKLNGAYDQASTVLRMPHGDERRQALDRYYAQLDADSNVAHQPSRLIGAAFSRRARSDVIASIFAALMLPALDAASNAEDRINSILALTQLAAALAVHRAEHGSYPETLAELVPNIVGALPGDIYGGKPFVYKRLDDGYLLYTIGENGRDDGGSNELMGTFKGRVLNDLPADEAESLREKIPGGADDFSIRLPISPYELPDASQP